VATVLIAVVAIAVAPVALVVTVVVLEVETVVAQEAQVATAVEEETVERTVLTTKRHVATEAEQTPQYA
jgi:hypothetical protein